MKSTSPISMGFVDGGFRDRQAKTLYRSPRSDLPEDCSLVIGKNCKALERESKTLGRDPFYNFDRILIHFFLIFLKYC